MGFVKLDTGILDSTLWLSDAEVRIVFITMLAMANPDGMCEATAPGIARRANLSIEAVREAIKILEAPDEDSRSLEDEGRRIRRVDGGYQITNFLKYREKDYTAAERKRRERERKRTTDSDDVTRDTRDVTRDVTPPFASASASASASGYEDESSSADRQRKSTAKNGKRRDELFEAIAAACGIDISQLTQSARGPLNRATKELREVGATPDSVTSAAAAYRKKYPKCDLTPNALAKHWSALSQALTAGKFSGSTKREGCLDDASPV